MTPIKDYCRDCKKLRYTKNMVNDGHDVFYCKRCFQKIDKMRHPNRTGLYELYVYDEEHRSPFMIYILNKRETAEILRHIRSFESRGLRKAPSWHKEKHCKCGGLKHDYQ